MAVDQNRVEFLLEKFSANDVSESEFNELCELIKEDGFEPAIKMKLQEDLQKAPFTTLDKAIMDRMLGKLIAFEERPVRRMFNWKKFAAAAAIIIILGVGSYMAFFKTNEKPQIAKAPVSVPAPKDVEPGKDGAILTLADGRQVVLDNAANGNITDEAVKNGNMLSYENADATEVVYNTMSTPKGRQYSLVLADGTKVWLNASSSVRFPTAFTGSERRVEITGEAYFEVAHDAHKPFHVGVNGLDVRVLGTHFNINSYQDEPFIKTTLLEGKVVVSRGTKIVNLNPGQQAVINPDKDNIRVAPNVDLASVMAWKNGQIYFEGADLGVIMRQISRWYDVEAGYDGDPQSAHISGKVSRNLNLSNVIKVLEESGIDIKMEGRKLIATPKP